MVRINGETKWQHIEVGKYRKKNYKKIYQRGIKKIMKSLLTKNQNEQKEWQRKKENDRKEIKKNFW